MAKRKKETRPASEFVFADARGHEWDVRITLFEAEAVERADFTVLYKGPVSLLAPSNQLLTDVQLRPSLMAAVIWAIVQPQLEAGGVIDDARQEYPDEQWEGLSPVDRDEAIQQAFIRRFDGATVNRARKALWGALADFFPDAKNALLKLASTIDGTRTRALARLEEMTPRLEAQLEKEVDDLLTRVEEGIEQ